MRSAFQCDFTTEMEPSLGWSPAAAGSTHVFCSVSKERIMQVIRQNNSGYITIWVGRWGEAFLFLLYAPRKSKDFCVPWELILFGAVLIASGEEETPPSSERQKADGTGTEGTFPCSNNLSCRSCPSLAHLFFKANAAPRLAMCQPERPYLQIGKLWGTPTRPDIHPAATESGEMPPSFTSPKRWLNSWCQLLISHIFSPTSPLLTPCQLTSPLLTAGQSHFISCWRYSSCLDTTQFLLFLITHFLAWSPMETSSSDNVRWPFLYYFPTALLGPWQVLKLWFAFLESQTLRVNDLRALAWGSNSPGHKGSTFPHRQWI